MTSKCVLAKVRVAGTAMMMTAGCAIFLYAIITNADTRRRRKPSFYETARLHENWKKHSIKVGQNLDVVSAGKDLVALSRQLNSIQRHLQQLICLSKPKTGTSETGGWCDEAVGRQHLTDHGLARELSVLMLGRTVAILGDGLGEYGRAIDDSGLADGVESFDGAPFVEELTDGRVSFMDLAVPQFWLPVYDWTICLEVLEHIPERFESIAVDNVVRSASVGVVLSWARPGQGGFGHVNRRPDDYVEDTMRLRGFLRDETWTTKLRDAATFSWFKFTINAYRRTNSSLTLFERRLSWTDGHKYTSVTPKP